MSEFGKGYAYCLGLFLAHAERFEPIKPDYGPSMWFNGAADHLFELNVPEAIPADRKKEIELWRDKCITFRYCFYGEKCCEEDVYEALKYAKNLLLEWDAICGVPCERGDFE